MTRFDYHFRRPTLDRFDELSKAIHAFIHTLKYCIENRKKHT